MYANLVFNSWSTPSNGLVRARVSYCFLLLYQKTTVCEDHSVRTLKQIGKVSVQRPFCAITRTEKDVLYRQTRFKKQKTIQCEH